MTQIESANNQLLVSEDEVLVTTSFPAYDAPHSHIFNKVGVGARLIKIEDDWYYQSLLSRTAGWLTDVFSTISKQIDLQKIPPYSTLLWASLKPEASPNSSSVYRVHGFVLGQPKIDIEQFPRRFQPLWPANVVFVDAVFNESKKLEDNTMFVSSGPLVSAPLVANLSKIITDAFADIKAFEIHDSTAVQHDIRVESVSGSHELSYVTITSSVASGELVYFVIFGDRVLCRVTSHGKVIFESDASWIMIPVGVLIEFVDWFSSKFEVPDVAPMKLWKVTNPSGVVLFADKCFAGYFNEYGEQRSLVLLTKYPRISTLISLVKALKDLKEKP